MRGMEVLERVWKPRPVRAEVEGRVDELHTGRAWRDWGMDREAAGFQDSVQGEER